MRVLSSSIFAIMPAAPKAAKPPKRKRIGRPPKPPEDVRDESVFATLTKREFNQFAAECAKLNKTKSRVMRELLAGFMRTKGTEWS